MDKCLKCGQCCHYENKVCKNLKDDNTCEIYADRIGAFVDIGYACTYRMNTLNDFVDCPYNTDKPIKDFRNQPQKVLK